MPVVGMLPNIFKAENPTITQAELIEVYKQRITEYISEKDTLGKTVADRYRERPGPKNRKLMIDHIWASYCYMMGQTNFYWRSAPGLPLEAPEWLSNHLNPMV